MVLANCKNMSGTWTTFTTTTRYRPDNVETICPPVLATLNSGFDFQRGVSYQCSIAIMVLTYTVSHWARGMEHAYRSRRCLMPRPPNGLGNRNTNNVMVAHTRLPNVGSRSWSRFLAVSLQVTWVINPAVGCHYFPPVTLATLKRAATNFVAWWTEAWRCEQFA